jgi:hypothetical protein
MQMQFIRFITFVVTTNDPAENFNDCLIRILANACGNTSTIGALVSGKHARLTVIGSPLSQHLVARLLLCALHIATPQVSSSGLSAQGPG